MRKRERQTDREVERLTYKEVDRQEICTDRKKRRCVYKEKEKR